MMKSCKYHEFPSVGPVGSLSRLSFLIYISLQTLTCVPIYSGLFYEAAQSTALARRLAVIMHRIYGPTARCKGIRTEWAFWSALIYPAFLPRRRPTAQQSVPQIRVADILNTFDSLFGNRQELVRATDWPREQIDTIDFYKDSSVSFTFPKKTSYSQSFAGSR
jgi:hypothetical protein